MAEADALTLLQRDHEDVAALLDRYETGKTRLNDDEKTDIADEICRKGEGGPTCMTRPLVRG